MRRVGGSWDFVCDSSLKTDVLPGEEEKGALTAGGWTLDVSQSSKNLKEKKKKKEV